MAGEMPEVQKIALGSGKIYEKEFTALITDPLAILKEVVKPENELGCVSGGASLEYKTTFKTYKDDLGRTSRTTMTEDEATLKGGVCTWNANTLKRICSTAEVKEDTTHKTRIVSIGGVGNYDAKLYVVVFENIDKDYGNSYVMIVGNNQKGITLTYATDKETVLDPEFSAQAADEQGHKVFYLEPTEKGIDILTFGGTI